MDPFSAVQKIVKVDLEQVFGKSLTSNILMKARIDSGAPLIGLNKDQYLNFINCICQNPQVKSMFGISGTADKLKKWKNSV